MTSIDIDRCLSALRRIAVEGSPSTRERRRVIEDAIASIHANGGERLKNEYLGVKNYAGFGDQREDHRYGYGPKHGYIVFRVGRRDGDMTQPLGDDEVYLLECVRDFGTVEEEKDDPLSNRGRYNAPQRLNLCDVLRRYSRLRKALGWYKDQLERATVESHAGLEEVAS